MNVSDDTRTNKKSAEETCDDSEQKVWTYYPTRVTRLSQPLCDCSVIRGEPQYSSFFFLARQNLFCKNVSSAIMVVYRFRIVHTKLKLISNFTDYCTSLDAINWKTSFPRYNSSNYRANGNLCKSHTHSQNHIQFNVNGQAWVTTACHRRIFDV